MSRQRTSPSGILSQPSTSRMSSQVTSSRISQSQTSQLNSTQTSSKALDNIPRDEIEKKVQDLVKFMLVSDGKKVPILKRDIKKVVLKDSVRAFDPIMEEASVRLDKVFGFRVVELTDKLKGTYILVNNISNSHDKPHVEWKMESSTKTGLLSIILCTIFMNGNVLEEADLWHALQVFGINEREKHSTFGDVRSLVMEEFVRQAYLEVRQNHTGEVTVKELRWGQRATQELKKSKALDMVAEIYGRQPQAFLNQWQEVKKETEEEEEEVMVTS